MQSVALGQLLQTFDDDNTDAEKVEGFLWAGLLVVCGLVFLLAGSSSRLPKLKEGDALFYRIQGRNLRQEPVAQVHSAP